MLTEEQEQMVGFVMRGALDSGELFMLLRSAHKRGKATTEEAFAVFREIHNRGGLSAGQLAWILRDFEDD